MMDELELKTILSNELRSAIGQDGGKLSEDRRKLLGYYHADPAYFPSEEGRSQVINRAVLETIEWAIPQIARMVTGDKVFVFEPTRPGEEAQAEQATRYVNHILNTDNDGFRILYTWIRDGLMQRNGYLKCYWAEERTSSISTYTGLDEAEYQQLILADDVEVLEETVYENPDPALTWYNQDNAQFDAPQSMLHDVKLRVWSTTGRVRIEPIPPEEILVSSQAKDTVLDGRNFVAHRCQKRVSDLREMGFDEELIQQAVGASGNEEWNIERISRFIDHDDFPSSDNRSDDAMKSVWCTESFLRVDWDGDGVAELRRVFFAGDDPVVIFENDYCDEVPIISWTPIPQSHRHSGLSLADLVLDIQEQKTAISRQILENLYLSNQPRVILDEMAIGEDTIDDLTNYRIGGVVRVNNIAGVQPLTVPFTAASSIGVIEYLDQTTEIRTGISRQGQGLDPTAMANHTATSASLIANAGSARIELISRIFAEQGMKLLAKRILGLVVRHQQEARIVRLLGEFVPIDVRNWRENMDITISVGFNKDQMIQHLMNVLQIQQTIVGMQKGFGGLVSPENVYTVLDRLTEAAGFREQFFSDPRKAPPTPEQQQPDPAIMKVQAEIQADRMRAENEIAIEKMKAEKSLAIERAQMEFDMQLETMKAQHQMALDNERERAKAELAIMIETMKANRVAEQQQRQQQAAVQAGPKREKTTVTRHDDQGRILEFIKEDVVV